MAPELLAGKRANAKADAWSLAVILFEMYTGRLPDDTAGDALDDFERRSGDAVEPTAAALLRFGLRREPAKRPTAADMAAFLRDECRVIVKPASPRHGAAPATPLAAPPPTAVRSPEPSRSRRTLETPAVVVDPGSSAVRCGFAGDDVFSARRRPEARARASGRTARALVGAARRLPGRRRRVQGGADGGPVLRRRGGVGQEPDPRAAPSRRAGRRRRLGGHGEGLAPRVRRARRRGGRPAAPRHRAAPESGGEAGADGLDPLRGLRRARALRRRPGRPDARVPPTASIGEIEAISCRS